MLRIKTNNSHSEHDLFIRLFLTSGVAGMRLDGFR